MHPSTLKRALYGRRKIGILQLMNALGETLHRVIGEHRTECLHNSAPAVELLINIVDGDTADIVAACQHIGMNAVAVHSLATVLGQQRRMNVDHVTIEVLNNIWLNYNINY